MSDVKRINGLTLEDTISKMMPYLYKCASRRPQNCISSFDDLVQEGIVGIIEVFNKYEDGQCVCFEAVAVKAMKIKMINFSEENSSCFSGVRWVVEQYGADVNERDTRCTGRKRKDVVEGINRLRNTFYTQDVDALGEFLVDNSEIEMFDKLYEKEVLKKVFKCINEELGEIEREIIVRYYGLNCTKSTLKEVGEHFGRNEDWARRVKNKAILKMKKYV